MQMEFSSVCSETHIYGNETCFVHQRVIKTFISLFLCIFVLLFFGQHTHCLLFFKAFFVNFNILLKTCKKLRHVIKKKIIFMRLEYE